MSIDKKKNVLLIINVLHSVLSNEDLIINALHCVLSNEEFNRVSS